MRLGIRQDFSANVCKVTLNMTDFTEEKQLITGLYRDLDASSPETAKAVLTHHYAPNHIWRGYHPFDEIHDPEAVAERFWAPLKTALTHLQRRQDVFMAGKNEVDGFASTWVVSMGHLMGLFDAPWLGIAPTGKMAFLRYCEFNKIENGQVTETAMYFDIPHLMMQTGLQPFPPQTAAHLVQPGPMTHDGLMLSSQPPEEGEKTLAAINAMISDLGQWNSGLSLEEELRRTWHEDMIWWGPAGIGATYTIPRYAKQHSGPFRAGFTDRSKTSHICRMAEGHFGGFFGWPNFTATPIGGFMGMPATGKSGAFRVIDIYRRDGDKLAENWIFIDLLHFWKQQGVDILARMAEVPRT